MSASLKEKGFDMASPITTVGHAVYEEDENESRSFGRLGGHHRSGVRQCGIPSYEGETRYDQIITQPCTAILK